jgi:hypothetical protein
VLAATGFWPAQVVSTEVELDICGRGMIRAHQTEVSDLLILIFECSIAVTAVAVAD